MMKKLNLLAITTILLVLGACKKDKEKVDNPTPTNEEELITTVMLHFYEKGNTDNHVMASFKDVDGVGGNNATIDTIKLDTNTIYVVSIELKDESKTPAVNITSEVKEESDEHLFCYESSSATLTVNVTDSDGTFPTGIETEWITASEVNSTIKILLKHQPDGQKDGTCTPGETDIEVDFPLVIQ